MQFLMNRLYKNDRAASEYGFTLIELITVILLLGIIGVMGSEVITSSFKGFSETDARMELFEEGKLAMMRMEREIHHMVPNAVKVQSGGTDIYFGKIDVNAINTYGLSGQYYHPVAPKLQWIRDEADAELPINTYISIYNTSWDTFSTTTNPATKRYVYLVNVVNTANHRLRLTNDGGTDKPVLSSTATNRYYPIMSAIRYYLDASDPTNQILRRTETPVSADADVETTLTTTPPHGPPLLSHVTALTFNYLPAIPLSRNALVTVDFTIQSASGTESVSLHKEIHIRNVP
jgi:MSHA biogenesis protein MshO